MSRLPEIDHNDAATHSKEVSWVASLIREELDSFTNGLSEYGTKLLSQSAKDLGMAMVLSPLQIVDKTATQLKANEKSEQKSEKAKVADFNTAILSIFSDKLEGKGSVTREDVDEAILKDHLIKGPQAAALFLLRQNFDTLAKDGKVGKTELKEIDAKLAEKGQPNSAEQMKKSEDFLSEVHRGLYPPGSKSESQERMVRINQNHRGNCYFESGLGSLAAIDPERLQSAITDDGADEKGIHTYSVRFPFAPNETYKVKELTDASLLANDVDKDSGTWMSVLTRAYGDYQNKHPFARPERRLFLGLDQQILPEDRTDGGSMFHDGVRMMSGPDTCIKQVVWSLSRNAIESGLDTALKAVRDTLSSDATATLKKLLPGTGETISKVVKYLDDDGIKRLAKTLSPIAEIALKETLFSERDPAATAAQLEKSICKQHLPATVVKNDGGHEISIIGYKPGKEFTDSNGVKHTSSYGFVTVRDQAGLSDQEKSKGWRVDKTDEKAICMTVEDFTKFYDGYATAEKK